MNREPYRRVLRRSGCVFYPFTARFPTEYASPSLSAQYVLESAFGKDVHAQEAVARSRSLHLLSYILSSHRYVVKVSEQHMLDAVSPPSQARGMCAMRVWHSRHERSPAHSVAAYGNGAFQIASMVLLMLCGDFMMSSGIGAQSGWAIYGGEGIHLTPSVELRPRCCPGPGA